MARCSCASRPRPPPKRPHSWWPCADAVCRRLGEHVYGVDVENLESVVVPLLLQRGETLTTAESCTGGLLAKRITDVAGASLVFHQGVVTYANEAKTRLLGVPEELLASVGAVSPEVARCMAEQACTRYGSSWGVGISGIAGPGGATATKPVGLVYIALSNGRQTGCASCAPTAGMGRAPDLGASAPPATPWTCCAAPCLRLACGDGGVAVLKAGKERPSRNIRTTPHPGEDRQLARMADSRVRYVEHAAASFFPE